MKSLTYSDYLKLDQLLDLQRPKGSEHDEMLFIIIHQSYELWFKEMLHELGHLQDLMVANDTPRSLHTMKRILTVLKMLVAKIDILETMSPLEFLAFRDRLESSSGFQSFQFRELEFVLGHRPPAVLERFPADSGYRRRLEERMRAPSLWDSFLACLAANDFPVPEAALQRDPAAPIEPDPAVQELLIRVYRQNPSLSEMCERLVDLDEGIQEWRYRHVKMVERTIGNKRGTGGSAGVRYLESTLSRPLFPDLWAIRTDL